MSERQITDVRGMGVEAQPDGTFLVSYHARVPDVIDFETRYLHVSWETLTHLLGNLQGTVLYEADKRMRNAAAGDCETCKNHRMVDVEQKHGGRAWSEYCPDCHERFANAKPAYPKPFA